MDVRAIWGVQFNWVLDEKSPRSKPPNDRASSSSSSSSRDRDLLSLVRFRCTRSQTLLISYVVPCSRGHGPTDPMPGSQDNERPGPEENRNAFNIAEIERPYPPRIRVSIMFYIVSGCIR